QSRALLLGHGQAQIKGAAGVLDLGGTSKVKRSCVLSEKIEVFSAGCSKGLNSFTMRWGRRVETLLLAKGAGSRDAMTKITDVHIARLLPRRESRTSLRRSHRSRKQNQPGLRRLRSERYPYR